MKLELVINGQPVSLTMEDARKLFAELSEVFAIKVTPIQIPMREAERRRDRFVDKHPYMPPQTFPAPTPPPWHHPPMTWRHNEPYCYTTASRS